MFLRPLGRSPWRPLRLSLQFSLHTRLYLPIHKTRYRTISSTTPPFPTTATCPSPTCPCSAMPNMPDGLPIDFERSLNGTMAPYAEQVLICTGKDDWVSRIEDENSGDNLAADIKELMGRGGVFSDPYHNVSILNSSIPPSRPPRPDVQSTSAFLVPSFKYVPFLPRVSFDSVQALVKGYLLPTTLHPAHDKLSPIHKDRLLRSEEQGRLLYGVRDLSDVLVLVCGHGGRDMRCGVLGPALRAEFEEQLGRQDVGVLKGPIEIDTGIDVESESQSVESGAETGGTDLEMKSLSARVGLISHIGGHKFAGNVILYIPPEAKTADGKPNALAGCGIWYGRVEPKHVEGIVRETVLSGRVIEELFRGGVRKGGEILRL